MARRAKLVRIQTRATANWIHNMSTNLGCVHTSPRPSLQQSTDNQIHVIPNLAHIFDASSDDSGHNTAISSASTKSSTILVRIWIANNVERPIVIRTDKSKR